MNIATIPLPSRIKLSIDLTDDQFFELCQRNRDYRFERTKSGELLIISPTGSETGNRNIELAYQLQAWSRQNNLGIAFDSSTVHNYTLKLEHNLQFLPVGEVTTNCLDVVLVVNPTPASGKTGTRSHLPISP